MACKHKPPKHTAERILDKIVEGERDDRRIAMALKVTRRTVARWVRWLAGPLISLGLRGRRLRDAIAARRTMSPPDYAAFRAGLDARAQKRAADRALRRAAELERAARERREP